MRRLLLAAALYALSSVIGLQLAVLPPGFASPLWPAAGVALGLTHLWGWPAAVGTVLGSIVGNTLGVGWAWQSVIIGLGAGAQAFVGAVLVRRWVNGQLRLTRTWRILSFAGIAGPVACLINGVTGPLVLWAAGIVPNGMLVENIATWWVGDVTGVLVVTPMVLAAARPSTEWGARRRTVLPMQTGMLVLFGLAFWVLRSYAEQAGVSPAEIWTIGAGGAVLLSLLSVGGLVWSISVAEAYAAYSRRMETAETLRLVVEPQSRRVP